MRIRLWQLLTVALFFTILLPGTAFHAAAAEPVSAAGIPIAAPSGNVDPGSADAIVNARLNFRSGPGTGFAILATLDPGTPAALIGRNAAGDWFYVRLESGAEGWLYGRYLTVNSGVNTNALPVVAAPAQAGAGASPPAAPAPAGSVVSASAPAVVSTSLNFRSGPGTGFARMATLAAGTPAALIGRNGAGDWFYVRLESGAEGWLYGAYLTFNSSIATNALPVVAGSAQAATGAASPPAAPVANSGFALGGQVFGAPYGQMQYAGMTWVKRQHKWSPGQTGDNVAGQIREAHNAGFKILLSIPGADHSNIDFNAYVEFLRSVASLPEPPDAIEVWNEMNIDREWPAGQISAQSYVQNMLAPAYRAIKGANPGIMVISGAPAPTGYFGGCSGSGCDDALYMSGMAAAGAASYMDCIGIHYNEGIIPPSQQTGDPRSHHYTRYFWGMVNTYYNAFGGSRPLCFTELGYLSPEGYGGLPAGFTWAQNVTAAQQAQWLAQAASLSASSGRVRMLVVWNVDSTTWNSDPQAGYAMIRPDGSCPACETLRQVMGR